MTTKLALAIAIAIAAFAPADARPLAPGEIHYTTRAERFIATRRNRAIRSAANWIEPIASIAPGWKCQIEHKWNLPNETICIPPAFTSFHNWQTTRACERNRANCIEPE